MKKMIETQKPYKPAFSKIEASKRDRILDTAIRAFAEKGFTGANINIIAREAQVSIGAMYNYFDTKEDLFLTVADHLHDLLESVLTSVVRKNMGFFEAIEAMMTAAVDGSVKYPDRTTVYLNIAAEHIDGLGTRLAQKLETVTLEFYRSLIDDGMANGELPSDTDGKMLSYFIDNQMVALQRAFATEYHANRMKLFLDGETDRSVVISRAMKLLRAIAD